MVRPPLGRLALALDVRGRHLLVHLDLDDPVSAVGVDDDEVRVVLLASRVPQDRQLADVEADPAGRRS